MSSPGPHPSPNPNPDKTATRSVCRAHLSVKLLELLERDLTRLVRVGNREASNQLIATRGLEIVDVGQIGHELSELRLGERPLAFDAIVVVLRGN